MNKKRFIYIIVATALLALIIFVGKYYIAKLTVNKDNKDEVYSNIANGCYAFSDGDWTYFIGEEDNETKDTYLCKINNKTNEKIVLDRSSIGAMALDGDWIYFDDGNFDLYKIKKDGSAKKKLVHEDVSWFNIVGDWIYYNSSNEKILKTNKLTGKTIEVYKEDSSCINLLVKNDWMYFYTLQDSCIYRIKTDGSQKEKLGKILQNEVEGAADPKLDVMGNFTIYGDYIYYPNGNDGSLYKMNLDGSNKKCIAKGYIEPVNIYKDHIYYFDYTNNAINRVDLDGSNKEKVYSDGYAYKYLNISNEFIYAFQKNQEKMVWIKIKDKH